MEKENLYEYAKKHNEIYEFWTGQGKYFHCGGECNRNMHMSEDYLFFEIEGKEGESKMYEELDSQMCMILDLNHYKSSDGLFEAINMVWRLFVGYESHRFKTRFNASEELKQKLHEAYDFKITQGREKDPNYLDSIVSKKELLKERFDFEF